MRPISECLGENVRRLRLERGFTQEGFAEHAGLSISFLQNIEHGKKWVGPKTIATLARALRVSEDELFRDCRRKAEPDPKDILLSLCRAFGLSLSEGAVAALRVRTPPSAYLALYEAMPPDVSLELTALCQEKGWSWEKFRKRMRPR